MSLKTTISFVEIRWNAVVPVFSWKGQLLSLTAWALVGPCDALAYCRETNSLDKNETASTRSCHREQYLRIKIPEPYGMVVVASSETSPGGSEVQGCEE